jgi:prepilin-type N-terminal cleavage/methylation domain-containing protein
MKSNQKGFTLIEIIAVLIILGILAAVAVPKFMDMTGEAKKQAAMAAVAEGMARANMLIAKEILTSSGTIPEASSIAATLNAGHTAAGDFAIAYTGSGSTITVGASGTAGNVSGGSSITGSFLMPTSN